jgi:hypothetical protein
MSLWDVLQIWRDWFHETFGELKFVRHRSAGDDPPDLELLFVRKTVAFEDTRLQPEHIGRADVLRNRKIAPDICTTVPAISKPTKSSKKLIETMLGIPQGARCANGTRGAHESACRNGQEEDGSSSKRCNHWHRRRNCLHGSYPRVPVPTGGTFNSIGGVLRFRQLRSDHQKSVKRNPIQRRSYYETRRQDYADH